ncbi:hypothetical protein DD595_25455, partial [Enterobacter cloacae complex sp. 4DZ3-17B2]
MLITLILLMSKLLMMLRCLLTILFLGFNKPWAIHPSKVKCNGSFVLMGFFKLPTMIREHLGSLLVRLPKEVSLRFGKKKRIPMKGSKSFSLMTHLLLKGEFKSLHRSNEKEVNLLPSRRRWLHEDGGLNALHHLQNGEDHR